MRLSRLYGLAWLRPGHNGGNVNRRGSNEVFPFHLFGVLGVIDAKVDDAGTLWDIRVIRFNRVIRVMGVRGVIRVIRVMRVIRGSWCHRR